MRNRGPWPLLLLLLLLLAAGCSKVPATPEAAADAARAFLQARVDDNAAATHSMLTTRAQKAISRSLLSSYFEQIETSYSDLGSPREAEPDLVRIPVRNLTLASPQRTVRWPEVWLTLRYEGNRWKVAWTEPLFDEAFQAYQNGLFLDQLNLAGEMVRIDPYHYRGHLELHFAYQGLKRPREAEVAIRTALQRATPAQLPDVYDAFARFMLAINAPTQAFEHARRALELAQPFAPDTYSPRWQADTLVVAGRAALAVNDRANAEAMATQAAALDPENANLAMFRHQLAATPSTAPPAR